jgi:DNA-binding MarR family transcriptional regulator
VDRRQRLLHLTDEGEALRQKLMAPQIARFRRAAAEVSGAANFHDMLLHLVNPENQAMAEGWSNSRKRDA